MGIQDGISLRVKIVSGYLILLAVIGSMAAILVHERERIREIEAESAEIRQVCRNINAAHRHITRLATLGESVIGWEEADSTRYYALRLRTDSLLQALKPYCRDYVRPAQIDTLRTLLAEKEAHLLHLTEILARQDEADAYRQAKEKRTGRGIGRQENRSGTPLRQRTAPIQRQPDSHPTAADGGNGCLRRQPAQPQPGVEPGTEPPRQRP